MTKIRVLAAQASNWLVAFDPGLLRLRSALRILVTMVVSLALLAALTCIVGQAVTVAMLGMLVSSMMAFISSIADRHQQWMTALLVLLLALGAATLGTLLVPSHLLGILGFIAILFSAVYLRRFGLQGMLLGMMAYQVYFTLVTFGALQPASITFRQLPWLLITIVIGILCGFVINVYLLRDPPERILRNMSRALNLRICALIDVLRAGLESGQDDADLHRRLRQQFSLVNEVAAMIQQQFAQVGPELLFAGIGTDELARRLFDSELAAEGLIGPTIGVVSGNIPPADRVPLVETLGTLRRAHCSSPFTGRLISKCLEPGQMLELDAVAHRSRPPLWGAMNCTPIFSYPKSERYMRLIGRC